MNAKDFAAMRLFRIDRELTLDKLESAVQACPPVDLLPLQAQGHGFTHLAEVMPGLFHLEMLTQERLLPKKVIKPVVAQQATEFEKLNGHKPGRKTLREIEEEVVAAMLPKAPVFEFKTHALVYGKSVVVGAGSMNKCKALLDLLVHALFAASEEKEPQLRYLPVAVNADISTTFRGWIEAKDDFFLEGVDDPQAAYLLLGTSFKSKGAESEAGQSSVISGKGVDLSDSKIERIIERVTELELIYGEVPFRLTDEFVVKGMKYPASKLDDPDSNAFLISTHVTHLWAELLEAFGGEKCK